MKTCTNSTCTQYNRPIVAKGVRFCPSCGEAVQASGKRRWLGILILAIGTVLALFILLLVTSGFGGFGGFGGMAIFSTPEIVDETAEPDPSVNIPAPASEPISLDPTPPPYWDNVYVEYILDASGSMQEELDGVRKIEIAKEVLATKAGQLPTTTNVGLRVYGHRIDYRDDKEGSCRDIELMVPPVRGGRDRVLEKLPTLNALGMTPLSESVIQSVNDFDYNDPFRHNSLVVISDGEETCGGNPCSMADDLINVYDINFTMYVIGFDILDNPTAQAQLQCLADKTGGVFLQANNRDELAQALDGIWDTMDQRVAADYEEQPPVAEADTTGVCVVPDVVGQDVAVAESSLTGAGLQPVKDFRHDDSVAQNAIISQDLAAGTRLEPCQGDVVIVVSLGPIPPTQTPLPPTAVPTNTPEPPIVTYDDIDQMPFTVGGFNEERAGSFSFQFGSFFNQARTSILANFPNASFASFSTVTSEALAESNIVILSSGTGYTSAMAPLAVAEQRALLDFVQDGGCPILLPSNSVHSGSYPANNSLIEPFGLEIDGNQDGKVVAQVTNPTANPITDGPFGTINSFYQNYPGGIIKLESPAKALATNSLGVALAVIGPRELNSDSGPVAIYSDSTMFANNNSAGFFSENEKLWLNTISYCLAASLN